MSDDNDRNTYDDSKRNVSSDNGNSNDNNEDSGDGGYGDRKSENSIRDGGSDVGQSDASNLGDGGDGYTDKRRDISAGNDEKVTAVVMVIQSNVSIGEVGN